MVVVFEFVAGVFVAGVFVVGVFVAVVFAAVVFVVVVFAAGFVVVFVNFPSLYVLVTIALFLVVSSSLVISPVFVL